MATKNNDFKLQNVFGSYVFALCPLYIRLINLHTREEEENTTKTNENIEIRGSKQKSLFLWHN